MVAASLVLFLALSSYYTKDVDGQLPSSFDARQRWSGCRSINTIYDQSMCGSCWAVSTASALSDRICIRSGQTKQVVLSARHLMTCCVKCSSPNIYGGCRGGNLWAAHQLFQNDGLVTGSGYGDCGGCQPYPYPSCGINRSFACGTQFPPTPCTARCRKSYGNSFNADIIKGSAVGFNTSNVEIDMMTEIMNNGPAIGALTMYEDLYKYTGGVYEHKSGSKLGGHAIKFMGWGQESGKKYWLIANSWGKYWGEGGFFKIIRGQNECGIESEFYWATPDI